MAKENRPRGAGEYNILPIDEEKEEKELKRMSKFELLQGGKEPPTTANNWLDRLEVGTIFLIQDKQNPMDFNLGLFKIVSREGTDNKVTVLATAALDKPLYINANRFCNKYTLYETIATIATLEEVLTEDIPSEEEKTSVIEQ